MQKNTIYGMMREREVFQNINQGFIKKRNRLNTVIILRTGHPKLRQAHIIRLGYPRATC